MRRAQFSKARPIEVAPTVVDVKLFSKRRSRSRRAEQARDSLDDDASQRIAIELVATPVAAARLLAALANGQAEFVLTELGGAVSVRATLVCNADTLTSPMPAIARRSQLADAWIDWERGAVERNHRQTMLSWTERRLLACLLEREGAAVTHRQLIAAGWPRAGSDVSQNLLGVYMHYLRRRLASVGLTEVIRTVRRTGYCLDVESVREREAGD
jgi:DNA-binding winged helix-turn-helix (wHTH) protein